MYCLRFNLNDSSSVHLQLLSPGTAPPHPTQQGFPNDFSVSLTLGVTLINIEKETLKKETLKSA